MLCNQEIVAYVMRVRCLPAASRGNLKNISDRDALSKPLTLTFPVLPMRRSELENSTVKKQKVMSENNKELFSTVGAAAQEIDDEPTQQSQGQNEGLHQTGAADAEGHPVQEIESLCMNCHKNGTTRLLLTSIPFFKEIVLMSFECPHCGLKNSEIQPASEIQEKGSRYVLKIEGKSDLNRQVVKSESCVCKFVELDLEIPAMRGQLTTVEGLLSEMIDDLSGDQEERRTKQPEIYEKIAQFIAKVRAVIDCDAGSLPQTLLLDDPAGNSWIQFVPGEPQHKWSHVEYSRTPDQNVSLGLVSADEVAQHRLQEAQDAQEEQRKDRNPTSTGFISDETEIENFANEVQTFSATCPSCYAPCETHMKVVNIPHFKDVILMSTVCDRCGYKSNEVKTGGEIPPHGRRITLKIDDPDDLTRDILKSETCGLVIPELHLDLTPGTLGGRFTTLEGLLTQVNEELYGRVFSQTSDSMDEQTKSRWELFFQRMKDAIDGKIKFTVVMEDPLAASYIQNVYAPDDDPNMTIEEFERSHQQNEDLGLLDMKTD
ncbi:unnamed protein product [Kuraishia capsulata CBS 1993]|uniref:Zinc finger ZPR1-type domain-containing protein n=1 Tax=Kuraishia capsulata CBS 1993 TaxID=1382522 RepID=W6MFN8_9ASCO|nr:uncharacterized protein KUCA_T00000645001 [Kuraishia capsulata CBS 1993]CDK24679.1 unnamed protein product [Kuraishia capsulata CBS 1993]